MFYSYFYYNIPLWIVNAFLNFIYNFQAKRPRCLRSLFTLFFLCRVCDASQKVISLNMSGKIWWLVNICVIVSCFICALYYIDLSIQYRKEYYYQNCWICHLVGVGVYICISLMQLSQNGERRMCALFYAIYISFFLSFFLLLILSWTCIFHIIYLLFSILLYIQQCRANRTLPISE